MKLPSGPSIQRTLLILSCLVVVALSDCDRETGPAGVTECFLGTPYYSEFQCGTCLTNAYIIQKSGGRHICRENASFCYYQCMIETFNVAEGPVFDGCSCEEGQPLPQAHSILPADCFSPDGTDCSWYGRCLAARYPCVGHQAEYAVSFGAKFCELHVASVQFTAAAAGTWIDAVRKCLQVELVPLLRLCRRPPTCDEIRRSAFRSHLPCYFSPYGGFSVCQVPPTDWLRVFWTLKHSFHRTFVESFKALFAAARGCGSNYQRALGQLVYVLELRPSTLTGRSVKVRRSVDLIVDRPVEGKMTDDEVAHSVMTSVSEQLGWNSESTVDWYAFAVPRNATDDELIAIQLFVVDLVDVGLMNASEAEGRRRLNDTMRQFYDAIEAGLLVGVENTSGPDHVTVTSLRRCDADVAGCRNASVVAAAEEPKPRRRTAQQRPRAVTSSNDATMTSSTWRTVAELLGAHFLSLCLNRLRFVADRATS